VEVKHFPLTNLSPLFSNFQNDGITIVCGTLLLQIHFVIIIIIINKVLIKVTLNKLLQGHFTQLSVAETL